MWKLDSIRQSCRFVADNSEHVNIRYDRIDSYASEIARIKPEKPIIDLSCHYLGKADDTIAFFVILDSINFGSGYFPHLRKRDCMSGYFTIASCLYDAFKKRPLKALDLMDITAYQCCEIFGQNPNDRIVFELMELFSAALKDLGIYVRDTYDSNFTNLIDSADHSSAKLVEILSAMRFFMDTAEYKGVQVSFFKRAQILSMDLHTAFDGKGPGMFNDLDKLTIFADNLVPHVLRIDGILEYDGSLSEKIDNSELIQSGSHEEIEIRACAVDAVDRISSVLGGALKGYSSAVIDNVLWHKGQLPYYKKVKPRHRTRSVYY